ncbi:MAG TPA: YihY/virulence factor BrkB family protein [Acidobacteriota bacterium]|nr:YihY/virulence factor BrkB family protein [Acidobacteriota bacterium]
MKTLLHISKDAFLDWRKHNAHRLGAAIAYYALFSIAPLLLFAIAIGAILFGRQSAQSYIVGQIQSVMGQSSAQAIQGMIGNARRPASGVIATSFGAVILLLGASGVFSELQDALNRIWDVDPRPRRSILRIIKDRFLTFAMVLAIGFLLLVSVVASTVLTAMGKFLVGPLPDSQYLLQASNFILPFGVITVLFAMVYKILPETRIRWRDVWLGAAVGSFLFTVGKSLIGLYLAKSGIASTYGAAGSLVVILVWVYWSTQILLYGAEFAQVYSRRHGTQAASKEISEGGQAPH